jgi:glycine cleavage system aminomethyltransferase T
LIKADTEIDIWPFGIRAKDCLRLEKSKSLDSPGNVDRIFGLFKATVIEEFPYDPNNEKLRA